MQTLESLNMSLTIIKSLLSDATLRAQQAEQLNAMLMQKSLTAEQFASLVRSVTEQMSIRSKERAVHQQAIIQATVLSLEAARRSTDEELRLIVNEICKQLSLSLSYMSDDRTNRIRQEREERRKREATVNNQLKASEVSSNPSNLE